MPLFLFSKKIVATPQHPHHILWGKKKFVADVFTWLNAVEIALGVKPLIYAGPDFAQQYLTDPKFSDFLPAVADYDT